MNEIIHGFSKLTKEDKKKFFADNFSDPEEILAEINGFNFTDENKQKLFDEFSENTIANFHLPYSIVPNFLINGRMYTIPMVIEESSVVAAAAISSKFWAQYGGFHTKVISTFKTGQVHFTWKGLTDKLIRAFPLLKEKLIKESRHLTENMEKRGGGILNIQLVNKNDELENYYQLHVTFDTVDAMGANFINSCLEHFAQILKSFFNEYLAFETNEKQCKILMSILSNYTPECLVECYVETEIKNFISITEELKPIEFARKFVVAVDIAQSDIYRATTHNKGIFNGIDAVAIATGNDWRSIESSGHAFAMKDKKYKSLTNIEIKGNIFKYILTIPMSIGTVGGLTSLHPLAKRSLELLGNPNAKELMGIVAAVGLANNFGAIRSLITKGIQSGHMKMHLLNILNKLEATEEEKIKASIYFKNISITDLTVKLFLDELRKGGK